MAHFHAIIQGQRGTATKVGSKDSGIRTKTNGWDIGATVWISHEKETAQDEVSIYLTGGSNQRCKDIFLGDFVVKDGMLTRKRDGDI